MGRRTKMSALLTMSLLVFAAMAAAQNAAKTPEPAKPLIPLKVDVVFNEYEGAKKVSSLPYTLSLFANDHTHNSSTRAGIRVPIKTGAYNPGGINQIMYEDVGTSIDCHARSQPGGFEVFMVIRRSFLYPPSSDKGVAAKGLPVSGLDPVFSQLYANDDSVLRDGQTVVGAMATDPISGRVIKVAVTLHVVKD
ncbi:MAG: hypothetical protein ACRD06_00135 [Terriglobia bacterium]